jgi:ribonuclease R
MTYTAVNAVITDRDPGTMKEYEELVPMFDLMKELADILRARRRQRGSIDFDFPESRIILDEQGRPVDIRPYERNAAARIIEDFMLLANETIAENYFWQELPFVYRTHDYPDPEKMKRLGIFINNFGYSIRTQNGEVHPKEIQKLLDRIEGTPEEALISRLTLRSMRQAKYSTVCTGHYGLAANYYTHFTSPIRRYPDLQIHRIIKENLRGGVTEKRIVHYDRILPEVTVQCSAMERRAEEAERETDKLKKCEYMSRHIGEVYEGAISGVTSWGLYVELPNTVEGLIRVSEMKGDYFVFDEEHMEMAGEATNIRYRLGQKVRVQVAGTDRMTRTIEFVLWDDPSED